MAGDASGWIACYDGKLHYFAEVTDASHCGKQWVIESSRLIDYPRKMLPDHTCSACLRRYDEERTP